ncbi:hypothetical protein FJZ18_01140 [Candidatus Pacearchaeota archaeon]|nr:hypothetical protein [Candidatus Pacearchaeota archaeon]
MKRMQFDANGKLFSVDNKAVNFGNNRRDIEDEDELLGTNLRTSDALSFLKEETISNVVDSETWSLYSEGKKLEPLRFSNGKSQEAIAKEIAGHINNGKKLVFLHGVCGTGKSAIALNIARLLGRASIVVPVKNLQRQYEEDYTSKKYVLKKGGKKMKIAMITGRENHDSVLFPGVSCADPSLPDTIKLTDKNLEKLEEYYKQNPYIRNKDMPEIKDLRRIAIAPANPYWSPILPAEIEIAAIKDAKKKTYNGLEGKQFTFYHRKEGCSYYDQYLAYMQADVLIFNAAKYKIEVALDRKPETEVEIIDEADEFLDNFSMQDSLNLTRLSSSLSSITPEHPEARVLVESIENLLGLEEKNKQALGINENKIYPIKETQWEKILKMFLKHPEIEAEIAIDEMHYANKAIEVAKNFIDFIEDTYITYKRVDKDIFVNLVTTNLSKKFQEIVKKNKSLVMMSGTLHSSIVLKEIFGIDDFEIVEAETMPQGNIEIHRTGKEFDCRYSNFSSGKHSRDEYLKTLSLCIDKAKRPTLVHVNAFEDLPTEQELHILRLDNLMSRERLMALQTEDKTGKMVSEFKERKSSILFTTKCSRGVDFPGDICNSVVFTKYPNPNVNGVFWKILQKTHEKYFWDFYRDKARREFLQRIYRALRSKDDHVFVLSPDSRVLDAVRGLQVKAKNPLHMAGGF